MVRLLVLIAERPNRGPDDGEQEGHPPKLAEDENVTDIEKDGCFADYDPRVGLRDGEVFDLGVGPGASPLVRYRFGDIALPERELRVPASLRRAA